ncbi:MAG: PQQ-like beta-propeller repeat protein, partial [Nocardiopsaceae bacterium]|nr:PQQ-like beta-propeller repeat protein [Nocardiopsaceae bacterium]
MMAISGCSGSPGSGGQRSARPCSTGAAPWLKPGGRAAGDIRWVVRLDSCYAGNKAVQDGQATFASTATPSLTVAFFAGRAWGVDTATGRVRWTRQVPQARRLPAQPPGSEAQDAVVAVLPRDVVISETTQLQHGSGGRCGCGTAVADLNPATGAVRHVSWIPLPGGVSYVGGGRAVIVAPSDPGRANGMIAAVDPATGKAWTRHHLSISQDTGLAVADQVLYTDLPQLAAGKAQRERYLDAYSLRTGASLPRLRLPETSDGIVAAAGGSHPGQPALPDAAGNLLVSAGSAVDSVDAATGALAWRAPGGGPFPGEVVAPSQHAVWTWR